MLLKSHDLPLLFLLLLIDENRIEKQPQRYVEAIEKFISLYGDQEIEIYSTPGRSEVSGNPPPWTRHTPWFSKIPSDKARAKETAWLSGYLFE